MSKEFFNVAEYKRIYSLIETNPFLAKTMFEKYIRKYPNDYSARAVYVAVLIILKELDNADMIIKKLEIDMLSDETYRRNSKFSMTEDRYIFSKIKLLSYQNKYQELYHFCQDNYGKLMSSSVNINTSCLLMYCKIKLGIFKDIDINDDIYFISQAHNYSKELFVNHISRHLMDTGLSSMNDCSVFISDFPLELVLSEIDKYLLGDSRLFNGIYEDQYVFKLSNCGKVKYKMTDYFKVICYHDTKNIITMYPASNCENLPYVELNIDLFNTYNNNLVKKLSQIDKFNRRYNRK